MASAERRAREARGRRAETLAALYLGCKGYRVLARRARTRVGEIDIVARQGKALVFVEVKARESLDSGLFALHPAALKRIKAAARVLAPRYGRGTTSWRIDAIIVRPWAWPIHVIAIDPDGAF